MNPSRAFATASLLRPYAVSIERSPWVQSEAQVKRSQLWGLAPPSASPNRRP